MPRHIDICPDAFARPKPVFHEKPRSYRLTLPNARIRRLLSINSALSGELARQNAPIEQVLPRKEQIIAQSEPARGLSAQEKRSRIAQKAAIVRRQAKAEHDYAAKTIARLIGRIAVAAAKY